jgi:hypothetical protein
MTDGLRVSAATYDQLKDLAICARRPTKRGFRAGDQQPIPSVFNVCRPQPSRSSADRGSNININNLASPPLIDFASSSSILLLNCRSLCNKAPIVRDLIADHRLDIVCLTETWLTGTDEDKVTTAALLPDGYEIIHGPRLEARGGGVAIVHRGCIPVKQPSLNDNQFFEAIDCLVATAKPMRLSVVYRPPPPRTNQLSVGQFMGEFSEYLSHLVSLPGELIVQGDFNFHTIRTTPTLLHSLSCYTRSV